MSGHAGPSRGGPPPPARRSPPRMAEDRDAIVSHRARPGGLGLPPLVLASVSRGRGRGRGSGRGSVSRGRNGRGGFSAVRGAPYATGTNTAPARPGQWSGGSMATRPAETTITVDAGHVPPHLRPYSSRPIDSYVPSRSPKPDHRRWDSPPANAQPAPRQVPAGPSNYAARPPSPPPRIPSSGSSASNSIPNGATRTLSTRETTSNIVPAPTTHGPSQIVPMKFKPKLPHSASATKMHASAPSRAMADSKEELGNDEETALNESAGPVRSEQAAPIVDEKEDIEMEDVKPDIEIIESPSTSGRQDRNTIDDNRNDGVLAWS